MAIRRVLIVVLLAREARSFQKVGDRDRHFAVLAAGTAGGREIFAALLGMRLEVLRRIALHEGEIERPAALSHDRIPDQFVLEEEADERRAAMKDPEEHEDVEP